MQNDALGRESEAWRRRIRKRGPSAQLTTLFDPNREGSRLHGERLAREVIVLNAAGRRRTDAHVRAARLRAAEAALGRAAREEKCQHGQPPLGHAAREQCQHGAAPANRFLMTRSAKKCQFFISPFGRPQGGQ